MGWAHIPNLTNRFEKYVMPDPNTGCHIWCGCTYGGGYGWFAVDKKNGSKPAHRVAYFIERGEIPDGFELHHVCENKLCVNPQHLKPLTKAEHTRIGPAAKASGAASLSKTHCRNGHEFSVSNTSYWGPGRKWRVCKECKKLKAREIRAAKKGE